MTVWQDVQQAIVNFFDWLTGVGGQVAEPMFQLGSWIAQGLSSLGAWLHSAFEWIYSGLEWLGSKFVEGLTWIWQGLNSLAGSLGAALTWVGSGIYSIGQWIWNGLLWLGRTILKALQDAWNWLLQQIINVWNWVVDTVESFVDSINDWWTGFIKSLREKWKEFLIVNMTIPMVWKATEKVITNPTTESVLGWLASPFVGVVTGEILDALLPIPTSKKVTLFPPLKLPRWDYQPITVELPPEPTTPEPYVPSPLPSVGYIPEWQKTLGVKSVYDVEVLYPLLRRFKPSVAIEPTVEAVAPIWVKQPLKVGSKGEVVYAGFETAEVKLKIAAEDVLSAPVTTWQDLAARVKSAYDVEVSPPLVIEQTLGIGAKSFAAIADVLVDGVSNIKAVPSVEVLTPAYVLQKLLGVSSIQRTLVTSTWIYRSAKIDEAKFYETTKPPGWLPPKGIGLEYSISVGTIPKGSGWINMGCDSGNTNYQPALHNYYVVTVKETDDKFYVWLLDENFNLVWKVQFVPIARKVSSPAANINDYGWVGMYQVAWESEPHACDHWLHCGLVDPYGDTKFKKWIGVGCGAGYFGSFVVLDDRYQFSVVGDRRWIRRISPTGSVETRDWYGRMYQVRYLPDGYLVVGFGDGFRKFDENFNILVESYSNMSATSNNLFAATTQIYVIKYTTYDYHELKAYDSSGSLLWHKKWGSRYAPWPTGLAIKDTIVYFMRGGRGYQGFLYGFALDGTQLFEYAPTGWTNFRGALSIDANGNAYFVGTNPDGVDCLISVDSAGNERWTLENEVSGSIGADNRMYSVKGTEIRIINLDGYLEDSVDLSALGATVVYGLPRLVKIP